MTIIVRCFAIIFAIITTNTYALKLKCEDPSSDLNTAISLVSPAKGTCVESCNHFDAFPISKAKCKKMCGDYYRGVLNDLKQWANPPTTASCKSANDFLSNCSACHQPCKNIKGLNKIVGSKAEHDCDVGCKKLFESGGC